MADLYLPPKPAILLPRKREIIRPGDPRFQVKPPWGQMHAMLMAGVTGLCGGGGAITAYTPPASGSFNGTNSVLSRTYGSTSNRDIWTISVWVKRGATGAARGIFGWTDSATSSVGLKFDASDHIEYFNFTSAYTNRQVTTATYTSTAVWIHILIAHDSTNGTAGDRNRVYVDGVEITSFGTDTQTSLNTDSQLNVTGRTYKIGNDGAASAVDWFNGLMSELIIVDGQQLTPSSFGETRDGAWKPKAISGLTFGTNGFYLNFANSGDLGNDVSGNNNDWTNSNVTQSSTVP